MHRSLLGAVLGAITLVGIAAAAPPQGSIVGWGPDVPPGDLSHGFIAIAAGDFFSLGLKADGSIVEWGRSYNGLTNVPAPNANFVMISGGGAHALGLKADGSIVGWGANGYSQATAPASNKALSLWLRAASIVSA